MKRLLSISTIALVGASFITFTAAAVPISGAGAMKRLGDVQSPATTMAAKSPTIGPSIAVAPNVIRVPTPRPVPSVRVPNRIVTPSMQPRGDITRLDRRKKGAIGPVDRRKKGILIGL